MLARTVRRSTALLVSARTARRHAHRHLVVLQAGSPGPGVLRETGTRLEWRLPGLDPGQKATQKNQLGFRTPLSGSNRQPQADEQSYGQCVR